MTESEWMECADPNALLYRLEFRASDRKLRLFACACARGLAHLSHDDRDRRAVETAEAAAEGAVPWTAAVCFKDAADGVSQPSGEEGGRDARRAREVAWLTLADDPWNAAAHTAVRARSVGPCDPAAQSARTRAQADLLRCFFGNPVRPPVTDPAWLTPTVVSLGQAAYDERELPSGHLDSARLAVLSDALEEAGCANEELLNHLRLPGPHYRGCWALDLVLGKE